MDPVFSKGEEVYYPNGELAFTITEDIYTLEQLLERGVTMSDGTAPDPNPFNEAFLMKEWERRNGS